MTDLWKRPKKAWRLGNHFGVYEGNRPLGTFLDGADAEQAVRDHNARLQDTDDGVSPYDQGWADGFAEALGPPPPPPRQLTVPEYIAQRMGWIEEKPR